MTDEEYESRHRAAREQYRETCGVIDREYAFSHSKVKVGDIVQDHAGFLRVEKISFYRPMHPAKPACIYSGTRMTKKLVPFKKSEMGDVYQRNLVGGILESEF